MNKFTNNAFALILITCAFFISTLTHCSATEKSNSAAEATFQDTSRQTALKRVKKAPYGYHGRCWLLKERILRK